MGFFKSLMRSSAARKLGIGGGSKGSKWYRRFKFFLKILIPFMMIYLAMNIVPTSLWYPGLSFDEFAANTGKGFVFNSYDNAVDATNLSQLGLEYQDYDVKSDISNGNICWSCGLFGAVLKSFISVANYFNGYLTSFIIVVLLIYLSFWILKKIFDALLQEGKPLQGMGFYKEIIKKLILVFVSIMLLFAIKTYDVMHYVIMPALNFGTGVSQQVMNVDGKVCKTLQQDFRSGNALGQNEYLSQDYKMLKNSDIDASQIDLLNYENEINSELFCMLSSVDMFLLSGASAGKVILEYSSISSPDFFVALLFIVAFLILYIYIPLSFLDIIFTIGMFLVLVPFAIGFYHLGMIGGNNIWNTLKSYLIYIMTAFIGFAIAVSIVMLSFFQIADAYYPGPVDGFSYAFPDYFLKGLPTSEVKVRVEREMAVCLKDVGVNKDGTKKFSGVKECYRQTAEKIGLDEGASSSWKNILPIIIMAWVAMYIFTKREEYTSWIAGGSSYKMAQEFLGFFKSAFRKLNPTVEAGKTVVKNYEGLGKRMSALRRLRKRK